MPVIQLHQFLARRRAGEKEISRHAKEDGIVTAAYKAGIPLYCPPVGDSTIAMPILATALSEHAALIRKRKKPVFEMGRELEFKFPK